MAKGPEPQAIQKLLHSRTTKLPTEDTTKEEKKIDTSSTVKDNTSPKVVSKSWGENKQPSAKGDRKKGLITGIANGIASVLPNKYQPEPVVKKIAFGSSTSQ